MVILSEVRKTSAGCDGIPYWVYSEYATELSHALSCLINYSINEGVVPQPWKQAVTRRRSESAYIRQVHDNVMMYTSTRLHKHLPMYLRSRRQ